MAQDIYDNNAKEVFQRYQMMLVSKTDWRNRAYGAWQLLDAPQNWIIHGESFDTPVRLNTLRDVISSLTDNFMQDPPEAVLEPSDKNRKAGAIAMKAYIDGIKESIHEKKVKRRVVEDMFVYGVGFRGVMYHKFEKIWDDGFVSKFDDVATYRINPQNIFIDEACYQMHDHTRLEEARDVVVRRFITKEAFKKFFDKEGFKNVDSIMETNWWSDELGGVVDTMSSRETVEKANANVIKLYEYYNQAENRYIVVANGQTIYEDKLTKAKGTDRIPIATYRFEPRNDTFWGKGIAEILAPYIYLEDTLFNLELMNLKLTLQPVMAVSGSFGFNPRVHTVQPGGVWTAGSEMNGKLQDNIQPLVVGNPNSNFYNFYDILQSKFTISSRTDLRSLEQQSKTATEVMQQTRSYNAHNQRIENINEVEAEGVLTELMVQITRSFMDVKDNEGGTKRVKIKNHVVAQGEGQMPTFIEQSGQEDFFDMMEDIVNTNVKVTVIDKKSQIADSVEEIGRWMQTLPMLNNLAVNSPELIQKIDFVGIAEQLVEKMNLDVKKTFKQNANDYVDEYTLVKQEIILGHNIDVPMDETREQSLQRMKFLIQWKQNPKEWKYVTGDAKKAWEYHFSSTMANITANQITKEQQKGTVLPGQMPPMPGQPGQPVPPQGAQQMPTSPTPSTMMPTQEAQMPGSPQMMSAPNAPLDIQSLLPSQPQ